MAERITAWITCPYCGQRQAMALLPGRPDVVLCDTEDVPGCDRYFAVEATLRVSTVVYTMRQVIHSSSQEVPDAEA